MLYIYYILSWRYSFLFFNHRNEMKIPWTSGLQKALGWSRPESPRTRFRAEQFCFRLLNMVLDPLPDVHYSMGFWSEKWASQFLQRHTDIAGWWWLEPWNFMTSQILGMSSSQLTFILFRGVGIPPTSMAFLPHVVRCLEYPPFGSADCGRGFETGCGLAAWSGTLIAWLLWLLC